MWEDDYNKQGGRWLINLDKKQRNSCLDNFWLEVMLCLIGESFEDDSQLVSLDHFNNKTFYSALLKHGMLINTLAEVMPCLIVESFKQDSQL